MHAYATDSSERNYILFLIAAISTFAAWSLHSLIILLKFDALNLWWIDVPSVWGFYGMFYAFFDKSLWKANFLYRIGLVKIPNLNGDWNGYLTTSYDNHEKKYLTQIKILQTWSKISIDLETENSKSHSQIAGIVMNDQSIPLITFEYLNEPKPHAVESMQIHRGTAKLYFHTKANLLEGDYYTGRGRQNVGLLRYERLKAA